ncbi:MAG: ABC transporter permease [Bacteroidales bacterium]|nr:ABC transporter permease [Bacteroidales bacterium]
MNPFWGFVKKEFLHIVRDVRTLVVLFGLPVVQILIFGFVIRNEIEDVSIAILDKSGDQVTREITSDILASGFFKCDRYLTTTAEIEPAFQAGSIREVLVFEENFAERLEKERKACIQLITDASDPNSARLIVNYTRGIVQAYLEKANQYEEHQPVIDSRVRMLYNADLKSAFMFVPGTMALVLMLVSAMMTSITITRERESGTMETLLVSPLSPLLIIAGKAMPYVLLSCINAVIIILMGYLIFELPLRGSLLLLFTVTMLFVSVALSLGIMISTFCRTQIQAMFIAAFALLLPTLLLSGFIFPVENMPLVLQWLCQLMPPKYFITAVKGIMIKGAGITAVWKEVLVLAGMLVFFFVVSAVRFKTRL